MNTTVDHPHPTPRRASGALARAVLATAASLALASLGLTVPLSLAAPALAQAAPKSVQAAPKSAPATSTQQRWGTGTHPFTIPAGVDTIVVEAQGGAGARPYSFINNGWPGRGGLVRATLKVTPGEAFTAVVGSDASGPYGGANGGADGTNPAATTNSKGGGGGGATDLRRGSTGLADRVVVAGGGGGVTALGGNGGEASGTSGGAGLSQCAQDSLTNGGKPNAGGIAANDCPYATPGTDGGFGYGGRPGFYNETNNMGGAGGGGWYGGGGGNAWGGGGAGSNYVVPTASDVSIWVNEGSDTPHLTVTFVQAPADQIALDLSVGGAPVNELVADGIGSFTATATVRNRFGVGVAGETVAFTSSDADQAVGPVVDRGNGVYTAEIRSSTRLGRATITARLAGADPARSAEASVSQIAGPAAEIALSLSAETIVANGTSEIGITARVSDGYGHPVDVPSLRFSSSDPDHSFGQAVKHDDGNFTIPMRVSRTLGNATISAESTAWAAVHGSAVLKQTAGAPQELRIDALPQRLVADGASTGEIVVVAEDAYGHGLADQRILLASSDPDQRIGEVTDHGDGRYSASITASTTAGSATITATDTSAEPSLVRTATLQQVPREAPKPVVKRLSATPVPRIAGTPRVGKKLAVRVGAWRPAPVTLKIQWLRGGKPIPGATKSSYRLTKKDAGKRVSVRVTGTKAGYLTVSKDSALRRIRR